MPIEWEAMAAVSYPAKDLGIKMTSTVTASNESKPVHWKKHAVGAGLFAFTAALLVAPKA
ncbi:MAG: hypothetical protein HY053_03400, partial [Proteobacteria bacterium]|nr:hypothetical protein [Pseudomonadota bacterium]